MKHKLKQYLYRAKLTPSNSLPNLRSRQFLLNHSRRFRLEKPSAFLRAAMALVRWTVSKTHHNENRVAFKNACLITGRGRGVSQRFSVARTRLKTLSSQGKLFGVKKASW